MEKRQLNKAQEEAVQYIDGPLLLVAGAGTGKTTVITEKIAYLIESGKAKPEEILALTFTEKAAREMQERIDSVLDLGYTELSISTFHSFCQQLLERYGIDIGLPSSSKLFTEIEAWLLVRKELEQFKLDYYRPLGNPNRHIHELLTHFSKCKDELVSTSEYTNYAEGLVIDGEEITEEEKNRVQELARAYATYNQLLLEKGALDFGDLVYYAVELLKKRPRIKEALQKRYKYILIDEFQDVNWAQYVLIQLLAEKSQLTVVGDDDQSIYSFRGSNVAVILRFKEDFPDAKAIVLNENYRSNQHILDTAYTSVQNNNPDRLEVRLQIDKKLKSGKGESGIGAVQHLHYHTLQDELYGAVGEMLRLKDEELYNWSDMAVLVRANNHAEPLIAALEVAGVPYDFAASAGLYRQHIILDCFNFLLLVDNYHESAAIFRLLHLPSLAMDAHDIQSLVTEAKKKTISYYAAMKQAAEFGVSESGQEKIEKLFALIHEGMERAKKEKTSVVLYYFLEESGYLHYLTSEEAKGNEVVARSIQFLKEFFDQIDAFEAGVPDGTVQQFVEYYRSLLEAGEEGNLPSLADSPDAVKIMTVHAAKGLEFPAVFILNLVEERFPTRKRSDGIALPDSFIHEKSLSDDAHYQEERRLFYVAVTRAKQKLYLLSADDYGGARGKKISRFLAELGYGTEGKSVVAKKVAHFSERAKKSPELVVTQYDLPQKFSFSQIKAYETCPYQYKLAHVLHIPTKGGASFSFGTSMHNTLQKFYEKIQVLNAEENIEQVIVPTLEELFELYDASWIPDWYSSEKQRLEFYEKGKEILKTFYRSEEGNWTVPVSLEGWFNIKIGGFSLHGRIDRIDRLPDGTLQIIDYKTGKSKEKLIGEDKEQLLIYQIAAQSVGEYQALGKPGKLTFYYLNDGVKTSFVGTEKELGKLQEKLLETMQQITTGDFTATPNSFACDHCDFREICEFRG